MRGETCAVCRRVGTLVRGADTCNACTPVPEGTWSEGVLALRGGEFVRRGLTYVFERRATRDPR